MWTIMVQATVLGIIYIEWLHFYNNLAEQEYCEKGIIIITVPYDIYVHRWGHCSTVNMFQVWILNTDSLTAESIMPYWLPVNVGG